MQKDKAKAVESVSSGVDTSVSTKHADKRREIAQHALSTLAELGFANVNLREVAARSGVQLGSIHYYFKDKTDLLIFSVRLYKDEFVNKLGQLIDSIDDPAALVDATNAALGQALEQHAHIHRLWYDIRAQALFDNAFRQVVEELEAQLVDVLARLLHKLGQTGVTGVPVDALATYITVDGWFRYYLQRHLAGDDSAGAELAVRLAALMNMSPAIVADNN